MDSRLSNLSVKPGQKNPIDSNTIRSSSLRDYTPRERASEIKYLLQNCQLVSNNCPIIVYGQAWTLMMTMPYARCAGDCQRICTGQRCANKYPTLARAEIPTQH